MINQGKLAAVLVSSSSATHLPIPAAVTPGQKILIKGLSGALGAGIGACVLFPLENIKIRQMVDESKNGPENSGMISTCVKILRDEGIAGFFVGLVPYTVYSVTSWGVFFLLYEFIK
jgi:hypothetical protein